MKYLPLFVFLVSFGLFAQERDTLSTKNNDGIKIGLVLSGGGAKGLAHIGALKVIEKSGIHIDYIGGSSMGGIIGSLYAMGYSAEQLDSIFRTTDFHNLIQDVLPRRVKDFYQKEGGQRYALTLPFDHFKLRFPSGLSRGQNIYNLLSRLMYPVRDVHDFSKLPIPFFCIGTDIETGESLVLDHGSLPLAVSAGGAIPSLFSPVLVDGRLVSDGGITDNFPVEEMRKHGVDYIIGIDVQDSLKSRDDLKSVLQILTQVNNLRMIKAMKKKRPLVDLYIKPDIKRFSVLSFDEGDAIIRAGKMAALKLKAKLDSLARLQQQPPIVHGVKVWDSLYIRDIRLTGSPAYPRSYILGKLKVRPNEKTAYKDLNEGLNNLTATGNFTRIDYTLAPQEDGGNNLVLTLHENTNKTNLKFSLHYDGLYKSAALINLTHKGLLFKNDMISLDLIFGDNIRYRADYFIDKGNYWSIGLRSTMTRFKQNIGAGFMKGKLNNSLFNVNKIELNYLDMTNQFYLETYFFDALRFGAGLEQKYTRLKTETILTQQNNDKNIPYTILEESNLFGPYGYIEYDDYDNAYFPDHGFHFRGELHIYLLGGNTTFDFNHFSIAKGQFGYAFTPLPKFTVRLSSESGLRIGDAKISALDFFLGGYGNHFVNNIEPFFGYDFLSVTGNSFIKGAIQFDYHIFPKNHVMLGYNIANIGDDLFRDGKIFGLPEYTGFSLGYGIESVLGPLEVFYSYSPETTKSELFFSLGFWF